MPRERDSPLDLGAGDRDVRQPALEKRHHLGAPGLRPHEPGVLLVVLEQRAGVLREAEEDVLLRLPDARGAVDRALALLADLLLRVEGLAAGAIPPLVLRRVEVAGRGDPRDERLDAGFVALLGRPDEARVGGA